MDYYCKWTTVVVHSYSFELLANMNDTHIIGPYTIRISLFSANYVTVTERSFRVPDTGNRTLIWQSRLNSIITCILETPRVYRKDKTFRSSNHLAPPITTGVVCSQDICPFPTLSCRACCRSGALTGGGGSWLREKRLRHRDGVAVGGNWHFYTLRRRQAWN